jgi:acetyl-CoA C-acetyltransferase
VSLKNKGKQMNQEVFIVDGSRTPFLKSQNTPGPFSAADLATSAGRELLLRNQLDPTSLGEVVLGCVIPGTEEANIARVVSLRLGCGDKVLGYTVQRNCASGLQAIDSAVKDIQLGRHDLVLAGGTEAMSRAPLLFNQKMVRWFCAQMKARTLGEKLKNLVRFRPALLVPEIALLKGLTDPSTKLSMGQTAEELAHQFSISRAEMDAYAVQSHQRALQATQENKSHFISPLYGKNGKVFTCDDGVREDSSVERLAKLKPFFDKRFGSVTAGNSSQISDGAALLLLASKKAVKEHQLPVLGKIVGTEWAGVAPKVMGIGPVHAITALLEREKMAFDNIDCWEINEAFAVQVLACQKALNSAEYCKEHFDLDNPVGEIVMEKLNAEGGAIALGHPVGASGARLVLQVLQVLERKNQRHGIASLCIGGGLGGAMLIERMS